MMKKTTLIISILVVSLPAFGQIINLGTVGTTYPIVEKDALVEIQEKVKSIDFSKTLSRENWGQKIKDFKPKNLVTLPPAKKNRSFLVDMTYSLEFDIPRVNEKGEVTGTLYPKGYTFNPLDYISYPSTIIFLDATDTAQLTWLKDSPYLDDLKVTLIVTDGNWYELSTELNTRVYYASELMIERFQIKALPSIVYQEGNRMRVQEIDAHEYIQSKNISH